MKDDYYITEKNKFIIQHWKFDFVFKVKERKPPSQGEAQTTRNLVREIICISFV